MESFLRQLVALALALALAVVVSTYKELPNPDHASKDKGGMSIMEMSTKRKGRRQKNNAIFGTIPTSMSAFSSVANLLKANTRASKSPKSNTREVKAFGK